MGKNESRWVELSEPTLLSLVFMTHLPGLPVLYSLPICHPSPSSTPTCWALLLLTNLFVTCSFIYAQADQQSAFFPLKNIEELFENKKNKCIKGIAHSFLFFEFKYIFLKFSLLF